MTTECTANGLPPIQKNLVNNLMHRADRTQRSQDKREGLRRAMPDIGTHTAKLTLILICVCLYVPLISYISG